MRKILSLKKGQQCVPAKNQKSITQFFKNNAASTQKLQISPAKSQPGTSKVCEKKESKRKATSPVLLETVGISDDDFRNSKSSSSPLQRNGFHTPKKFKSEHDDLSFARDTASHINQKSQEKENGRISKLCSKRNGEDHNDNAESFSDSQNEDLINRSPLTPIKIKINGESNEIYSKLSSNYEKEPNSTVSTNGNLVGNIDSNILTPKKVLNFEDCGQNGKVAIHKTPRKSLGKGVQRSPMGVFKTPEKLSQEELSPSKSGSTVKTLEFSPQALDEFEDQWEMDDVDENAVEDLDLTRLQRCEVISVTQHPGQLELRLKNGSNKRGTCFVEGVWLDTPLRAGEVVGVLAARGAGGRHAVSGAAGLLALRPDHLVSCTSVVGAVFCRRKAVLQERFRGIDAGNVAMTIGILVHELVQKALTENIMDISKLRVEADRIIMASIQMLYDCGLSEEEARTNMQQYLPPLAEFMQAYVAKTPLRKQPQKDQWRGHIDKVLDIEENLCCPQLGLKGKIDATLQVTTPQQHERIVVPLELKSGRASVSAEHRGQLVLYGMMLSALKGLDPATSPGAALLLYLKERVEVREVSCGYPERRDLMLLRNQLVQCLAPAPNDVDPEELTDIEDAASLVQQRLPEPVHHQTACAGCPYLTLCSLHLWHTEGPRVSESHPLSKLRETALGHLSSSHIQYFLQWAALLRIEERAQMLSAPLHALWTDTPDNRSKRGTCAANLKLKSVEPSDDRYLHRFDKQIKEIDSLRSSSKHSGPQEGDFCIVSIDGRPWIAAGVVTLVNDKQIHILLERDVSRRLSKDTAFHIDTYESYATTVQNLTNLGVLLEDSERSARLRRIIIDRAPPQFDKKLPRDVGRLGSKLMRSLNIEQQRAVLRAIAAKDYALIRGLPGTGKTQTTSVLIQMLVGLKQRVLVTAHTHSAVDTLLSRLPASLRVMRLGNASRVAPGLRERCEHELVKNCNSVKQLEELYSSMEVVGVTCLGANHAMLSRTVFDACIVDEATQVLQATALRPLLAAHRIILVGDPDQLPPTLKAQPARRLGMEESLFHRLTSEEATTTLHLQYRMNQQLVDIANKVAYREQLKCAHQDVAHATINIDMKRLRDSPPWLQSACSPERGAWFIDVTSEPTSQDKPSTNVAEACVAMAIVRAMMLGGVNPSDIGVIAPYRDQVALVRRGLHPLGVDCSTVDQFQGRDKSVVLYTSTKRDALHDNRNKGGEILNDQRRLAVSVTRAKHKLLVIGNSLALQRYMPLQRLVEACPKLPLDKLQVESVVDKYKKEFL